MTKQYVFHSFHTATNSGLKTKQRVDADSGVCVCVCVCVCMCVCVCVCVCVPHAPVSLPLMDWYMSPEEEQRVVTHSSPPLLLNHKHTLTLACTPAVHRRGYTLCGQCVLQPGCLHRRGRLRCYGEEGQGQRECVCAREDTWLCLWLCLCVCVCVCTYTLRHFKGKSVCLKGLLLSYNFLHTAKMALLRDILTVVARIPL